MWFAIMLVIFSRTHHPRETKPEREKVGSAALSFLCLLCFVSLVMWPCICLCFSWCRCISFFLLDVYNFLCNKHTVCTILYSELFFGFYFRQPFLQLSCLELAEKLQIAALLQPATAFCPKYKNILYVSDEKKTYFAYLAAWQKERKTNKADTTRQERDYSEMGEAKYFGWEKNFKPHK